jgi:hypothetical protein
MDVQYPPELQGSPDMAPLEQATALLTDIVGPLSSQRVKEAAWTRVQDPKGRTLYRLTIQDDFGNEASTDLAPDDLQNPLLLRYCMPRLWGDLLKVRHDLQHQRVLSLLKEITPG